MNKSKDNNKGRLIGIIGGMASGKSSLTNHLIDKYGFTEISFANILKQAARLLGLYSDDIQRQLGLFNTRHALQSFGELMRDGFSTYFWIILVEAKVKALLDDGTDVVISDVRYVNEAYWIKLMGGKLVYLELDGDDEVVLQRIRDRGDTKDNESIIDFMRTSAHSSEVERFDIFERFGVFEDALILVDAKLPLDKMLAEAEEMLGLNKNHVGGMYT